MHSARHQSPRFYSMFGYTVILLIFGGLGSWVATAQLDSAVIAQGTVVLEGNRRAVQHLEGGLVAEVHVSEGQRVKAGDLLLRMDQVQANGNLEVLLQRLGVARALEARLAAERDLKDKLVFDASLRNDPRVEVIAALKDQQTVFLDRRAILDSNIEIKQSRIEQLNAQVHGLEIQKDALEKRLSIQSSLMERYRTAGERGVMEGNILAQREDEFIQLQSQLGAMIAEIARVRLSLTETRMVLVQQRQEYRERAGAEMEEVRRQIGELEERIIISEDILKRTEIRAGVDGTVQNVKVFTAGSVIGPGMVLMEIVPESERLIVSAMVSPRDIDSIHIGLQTEIRFSAIADEVPQVAFGELETVSRDVITPEDANQAPYYRARISVDGERIPEKIRDRVTAGMPVDVIINTGERTVLAYLIEPLADTIRKSMREK